MEKYYDIWSNDLGIYQALLSYENKKTTDVEGSFYLGTILSTSSKNAIKECYEINKIQKVNLRFFLLWRESRPDVAL